MYKELALFALFETDIFICDSIEYRNRLDVCFFSKLEGANGIFPSHLAHRFLRGAPRWRLYRVELNPGIDGSAGTARRFSGRSLLLMNTRFKRSAQESGASGFSVSANGGAGCVLCFRFFFVQRLGTTAHF